LEKTSVSGAILSRARIDPLFTAIVSIRLEFNQRRVLTGVDGDDIG